MKRIIFISLLMVATIPLYAQYPYYGPRGNQWLSRTNSLRPLRVADTVVIKSGLKAGTGISIIRMYKSFNGNAMMWITDSVGNHRFFFDSLGNQTWTGTSNFDAINVGGGYNSGGGLSIDSSGNLKLDGSIWVKGVIWQPIYTELQIQNNSITLNAQSSSPTDLDAYIGSMSGGTLAVPTYTGLLKWTAASDMWAFGTAAIDNDLYVSGRARIINTGSTATSIVRSDSIFSLSQAGRPFAWGLGMSYNGNGYGGVRDSAGNYKMYIDSLGRIGIGTIAPTSPLHVYSSAQNLLTLDGTDATYTYITLKNSGKNAYIQSTQGTLDFQPGTNKDIKFLDGGGLLTRMLIKDGGNLGVSTTTPMHLLSAYHPLKTTSAFGITSYAINKNVSSVTQAEDSAAKVLKLSFNGNPIEKSVDSAGVVRSSLDSTGIVTRAISNFALANDACVKLLIAKDSTGNASTDTLFVTGIDNQPSYKHWIDIDTSAAWNFTVEIAARSDGGSAAAYSYRGVIKNVAGTTSIVGSVTKTVIAEDDAAWDANVQADDTNDALQILVTGAAAVNIRWVADIKLIQVKWL